MTTAFGECGWEMPERPAGRCLDRDQSCDCVIIGAGVTGLAVARRLAAHRPDWDIAVVDELRVGDGAAGRNSGFVMDLGHYQRARGVEGNRSSIELSRFGQRLLRDVVVANDIECQWSECGRYHVAVEPIGLRKLDAFARSLELMAEPFSRLSAEELSQKLGTSYYQAGLQVDGGAMVQPAALAVGLAKNLPDNVQLYENTSVKHIVPGKPHQVIAEGATLTPEHLVLANNGSVRQLGYLRGRVIPLFTFASLSRPLTASEQSALGGLREWGAIPEERMGSTLRRTQDQRLLLRATVSYTADADAGSGESEMLARARDTHRRSFDARFPMLRDVELEHTWGGKLGMTLNDTHCFGTVGERIYAAAGYNGVGLAMGTALGTLLADHISEQDSQLLRQVRALPTATWMPPDPLLGVGLRAYTSWLAYRAGAEL